MNLRKRTLIEEVAVIFIIMMLVISIFLPFQNEGSMITAILIIISGYIPTFTCFIRTTPNKNYDFFQPGTMVAIFYYIYVILPGITIWLNGYEANYIYNSNYQLVNYVFFIGLVAMIGFSIGYKSKVKFFNRTAKIYNNINNKNRWYRLFYLMISIGLIFKILHFHKVGGISNELLLQLSPTARRETGVQFSGIEILGESLFDWGILLVIFMNIAKISRNGDKKNVSRKIFITTFIVIIVAILEYILSAKRSVVAPFILLPLIWYHYLIKKISFKKGIVFTIVTIFLMVTLLYIRILLPLYIKGDTTSLEAVTRVAEEGINFYLNSGEFSSFEMIMLAAKHREELISREGGYWKAIIKYNFEPLLYLIPRAVWANKPKKIEGISHVFAKMAHGWQAEHGQAVTIFGVLYICGHIAGVFVGMLIIGLLFRNLYFFIYPWQGQLYGVFFYGILFWMIFQFFRFGDLGFTLIFFIQSQMIGVLVMLWMKLVDKTKYSISSVPI